MAGGHGVYKILGRNISSQYLVLGTWVGTGGAIYLSTRKKEEKKLNEGPAIQSTTADPEETKNFLKDAEKEGRKPAAHAEH